MINLRAALLILLFGAGLHAECVPGGLAVVVPAGNATEGLSMVQLRKLVIGDVHAWPDKHKVTLVSTDPEGAVFKCLLASVIKMSPPEFHVYLLRAEFRGEEPLHMKTVDSSAAAVRALAILAGGISLVEATLVPQLPHTVKVVRIDGKAPGEAGYPF